jgi:CubicO group peptidase (beta-lactamase class C family)
MAAVAIITVSLLSQRSRLRSDVKLNAERMLLADSMILSAIDNGDMPGAVLCVVGRARDGESMGRTLYLKAYGNQQVISGSADGKIIPDTIPMSTDAIFDLASLSKCVGTTMAVMRLVEQGRLRLTDNVSQYIPGFKPWESKPEKRGEKI